jgi:hypothetical protein
VLRVEEEQQKFTERKRRKVHQKQGDQNLRLEGEEDEKSVEKQEKIKEVRNVAVKKERPVKDVKKEDKNKM